MRFEPGSPCVATEALATGSRQARLGPAGGSGGDEIRPEFQGRFGSSGTLEINAVRLECRDCMPGASLNVYSRDGEEKSEKRKYDAHQYWDAYPLGGIGV